MASAKKCWALSVAVVFADSFDSVNGQSLSVLSVGGAFGIGIAVGVVAMFVIGTIVALAVWMSRSHRDRDAKLPPTHMRAYREGDNSMRASRQSPYDEIALREMQPATNLYLENPVLVESRPSSMYSIPVKMDKLEHGYSSIRSKI